MRIPNFKLPNSVPSFIHWRQSTKWSYSSWYLCINRITFSVLGNGGNGWSGNWRHSNPGCLYGYVSASPKFIDPYNFLNKFYQRGFVLILTWTFINSLNTQKWSTLFWSCCGHRIIKISFGGSRWNIPGTPFTNMVWNLLSISKLQRCNRWSLRMDE